jgi:hypothetical protein
MLEKPGSVHSCLGALLQVLYLVAINGADVWRSCTLDTAVKYYLDDTSHIVLLAESKVRLHEWDCCV